MKIVMLKTVILAQEEVAIMTMMKIVAEEVETFRKVVEDFHLLIMTEIVRVLVKTIEVKMKIIQKMKSSALFEKNFSTMILKI